MANIRGMENVLGDRCISLTIEKSDDKQRTSLIENFEYDSEFQIIRGGLLGLIKNFDDDLNYFGNIFEEWNSYIKKGVKGEKDVIVVKEVKEVKKLHTFHTNHSIYTFFQKISKTNISGRDLELFFPLFLISDMIGEKNIGKKH